jgi:ferredoxin
MWSGIAGITISGIIIIVLVIIVFGRIYCSTICPLGFLQDLSIFLGRTFRIKHEWKIKKIRHLKLTRIIILSVTVLLLIAGSAFATGLLEPFSILSRFLFTLKILFTTGTNISLPAIFIIGATTLGIVLASIKKGRFFCSWICPVGTLLWGVSKLSFLRFKINTKICNHCNQCYFNCKSGAIDVREKAIDPALCVGCFNCLSVCDKNAISVTPDLFGKKKDNSVNNSIIANTGPAENRRRFIKQVAFGLVVLGTPHLNIKPSVWHADISGSEKKSRIFPLGSNDLNRFKSQCTGCMICAERCPSGIIFPDSDFSFGSPIIPVLDYRKNYCLEECVLCSHSCPTGALQKVLPSEKKSIRMANLELNLAKCRIVDEGLECSLCADICPLDAVEMTLDKNHKFRLPVLKQDLCNGCGKCMARCPVSDRAQIFHFTATNLPKSILPHKADNI